MLNCQDKPLINSNKNYYQKPSVLSDIQYAKGVGPKYAKILNRLSINNIYDLLHHFPRDYSDRSNLLTISNLKHGAFQSTQGRIIGSHLQSIRKGLVLFKVVISDSTSNLLLVWFNQSYLKDLFKVGTHVIVSGKVEYKYGNFQIQNPEFEFMDEDNEKDLLHTSRIAPVYPLTENITQKYMRKIIYQNLERHLSCFEETLEYELGLMPLRDAIFQIHFPDNFEELKKARHRLAFEELLCLHLAVLLQKKSVVEKNKIFNYDKIDNSIFLDYEKVLPFTLTSAQKRVCNEIFADLKKTLPMNRLLQGDVGSGKTVVAGFSVFSAFNNNLQSAIMAPTEILAEQHFKYFSKLLAPFNIECRILTSSTKKRDRKIILEDLASGKLKLLVGTHALITEDVIFKNLGLVIIDEQHRFGVLQRASLRRKANNPDLLVMTATPIPRTLALTFYGDLDVSTLDELPKGRRPILSYWAADNMQDRVFEFVKKEIKLNRQAYFIYPLVEESDKIEAKAVIQEAEKLSKDEFEKYRVGFLHGKMKSAEKEEVMGKFKDGILDILISTTVIEVGVDVPNASIMVIFHADRFGLSQLHQIRGRVGRGTHQSYCVFVSDPKSEEAVERLKIMCSTNDGFEISEHDLKLRGGGEYLGTRQHGFSEFKIADLLQDMPISQTAREIAIKMIDEQKQTRFINKSFTFNSMTRNAYTSLDLIH